MKGLETGLEGKYRFLPLLADITPDIYRAINFTLNITSDVAKVYMGKTVMTFVDDMVQYGSGDWQTKVDLLNHTEVKGFSQSAWELFRRLVGDSLGYFHCVFVFSYLEETMQLRVIEPKNRFEALYTITPLVQGNFNQWVFKDGFRRQVSQTQVLNTLKMLSKPTKNKHWIRFFNIG